jgi:hypothetical protein
MTPVRSPVNQYRGINAHLNSQSQANNWNSFHAAHIVHLTTLLRAALRPLGYTADLEQSLQIRRLDASGGALRQSDVTLYDPDPVRAGQPALRRTATPGAYALPLPALFELDETEAGTYKAVAIYQVTPESRLRGEPIAWLELLSPSNKPRRSDFETYRAKREALIHSGLVFVEIDYLHQQPPTFALIPNYAAGEPDAHTYRLIVIDPRPAFRQGEAHLYPFSVDEPLPTVTIPLSGADHLPFDFDTVYQRTFTEMFLGDEVDYAQFPPQFASYQPDDQARIARRMLAVCEAHASGQPLDTLLPPLDLPTDEVLSRLAAYGVSPTDQG